MDAIRATLTNKIQITSEQLLREAQERQEPAFKAPQQRIHDIEELREFQGRKRTEFEGRIRYSRDSIRSEYRRVRGPASMCKCDVLVKIERVERTKMDKVKK